MLYRRPKWSFLDELAGSIVRSRGICENPDCRSTIGLEWAHIRSRRFWPTRWDLDNAFCLCGVCHDYWTVHPKEFIVFVKRMIGETKYDALVQRSLSTEKIDFGLIQYKLKKAKREGYNGIILKPLDSTKPKSIYC